MKLDEEKRNSPMKGNENQSDAQPKRIWKFVEKNEIRRGKTKFTVDSGIWEFVEKNEIGRGKMKFDEEKRNSPWIAEYGNSWRKMKLDEEKRNSPMKGNENLSDAQPKRIWKFVEKNEIRRGKTKFTVDSGIWEFVEKNEIGRGKMKFDEEKRNSPWIAKYGNSWRKMKLDEEKRNSPMKGNENQSDAQPKRIWEFVEKNEIRRGKTKFTEDSERKPVRRTT
jgi:hypothetical protein